MFSRRQQIIQLPDQNDPEDHSPSESTHLLLEIPPYPPEIPLPEDKSDQQAFHYYQKDLWGLICRYLGVRDVCHIGGVNKRLNHLINRNAYIWHFLNQREFQGRAPLEEMYFPLNLLEWEVHMNDVLPLEAHWRPGTSCEAKRDYMHNKLQKGGRKLMFSKDMRLMRVMKLIERCNVLALQIFPLLAAVFLLLLELKLLGVVAVPFLVCFAPVLFYVGFFVLNLCVFFVSLGTKWEQSFFWGFHFRFCKVMLWILIGAVCVGMCFAVLLVLRLDNVIESSWNVLFPLLELSIFAIALSFFFETDPYRKQDLMILEIPMALMIASAILTHVSVLDLLPQSAKWYLTFIPFYLIDTFLLIYEFIIASELRCGDPNLLVNLLLFISILSFIIGNVMLPLFLQLKISLLFPFSFLQLFFVLLQVLLYLLVEFRAWTVFMLHPV